jgi:hypothetical protein
MKQKPNGSTNNDIRPPEESDTEMTDIEDIEIIIDTTTTQEKKKLM